MHQELDSPCVSLGFVHSSLLVELGGTTTGHPSSSSSEEEEEHRNHEIRAIYEISQSRDTLPATKTRPNFLLILSSSIFLLLHHHPPRQLQLNSHYNSDATSPWPCCIADRCVFINKIFVYDKLIDFTIRTAAS